MCTLSKQREAPAERGGGHVRGRRSGTAHRVERQSTCSESLKRCTPASARKAYAVPTVCAKLALECQAMTPSYYMHPATKRPIPCARDAGMHEEARPPKLRSWKGASLSQRIGHGHAVIGTHTLESDGRVCLEEACHEQPCVLAAWEQARAAPQSR